jgi:hypothetical protein
MKCEQIETGSTNTWTAISRKRSSRRSSCTWAAAPVPAGGAAAAGADRASGRACPRRSARRGPLAGRSRPACAGRKGCALVPPSGLARWMGPMSWPRRPPS